MSHCNTFVDELYNEFLVCHLCSEKYKQPKTLNCMHTFCASCLEMHYDMEEQDRPYRFLMHTRALSCPICRIKTELPAGGVHRLSDNFLVANLGEVINRQKCLSSGSVCEICTGTQGSPARRNESEEDTRDDPSKKAVIKCLDCVKMLCQSCANIHRRTKVTQMHSLFDVNITKDIECKIHENESLKFYCESCENCICVLCTFQAHKNHDISSLGEGLERHRGSFELLLENCESRMTSLREQLELIEKCEIGIIEAEGQIRGKAIDAIAAVRRREKELMTEIRETIGEKTLQFLAEKDTLRENLKNIETTFRMTDIILKGTSIELLMAKKEMHQKMNDIVLLNIEATPDNLNGDIRLCMDFPELLLTTDTKHIDKNKEVLSKNTANRQTGKDAEVQTNSVQFGKNIDIQTDLTELGQNVDIQTDQVKVVSVATEIESDFNQDDTKIDSKLISEGAVNCDGKLENSQKRTEDSFSSADKGLNSANDAISNIFTSSEKEVKPATPVELIFPVEYVTPEDISNNEHTEALRNKETEAMPRKYSLQGTIQPIQLPVATTLSSPPFANTKANVAKNWMNSCSRRSSVTSSFEHIPANTSSGAVRMLKGFLRMSDGASGNAPSSGSLDIADSVTSPGLARPIKTSLFPRLSNTVTTGTAMEPVILTDSGTSMSYMSYIDKETSTPHILQTNKSVATENQEMVDKGTSTVVDVTAAYRNLTTCRRLVTVSRGTCTPKNMYPFERATSPIVWPGSTNQCQVQSPESNSQVQTPASNSTGLQISFLEIPM